MPDKHNKTMDSHPKFAVVGHPNKGKSSIVSSLAMDDTVQISDTPGTTTKKRSFPLSVDGKTVYELFDTPGFQRARQVLAWLEKHDVSAARRHEVVQQFIHEYKHDPKFNDEIELLEPIMEGAGIIYVVDASKPYGDEYEAEMEILRWTGEPSMALVNHIGDTDYSQEWKRALGHYFKMVRTYNPMEATPEQHIAILESMAQLKEEWIVPVKASIKLFEDYQKNMVERSADYIAKMVYGAITKVEKLSFDTPEPSSSQHERLERNYKNRLRKLEEATQKHLELVWNHSHFQKEQSLLPYEGIDLFSEQSASIFGLSQQEMIVMGATSGAAAGAAIDLLTVGHTLLLGGTIGALMGGVSAYFGFDKLSDIRVFGRRVGQRYLQMGPMKNRNFPYILLGRALYYTVVLAHRSHAKREVVKFSMDNSFKEAWLTDRFKKELEKFHKKFRSGKETEADELTAYAYLIEDILRVLL